MAFTDIGGDLPKTLEGIESIKMAFKECFKLFSFKGVIWPKDSLVFYFKEENPNFRPKYGFIPKPHWLF